MRNTTGPLADPIITGKSIYDLETLPDTYCSDAIAVDGEPVIAFC
jgi:hypothetical protein